uniref:Oxidation resistance protein 1 n=1 Tax=Meloidogyne enterolobii TaxID=390850 RepID=A0A6V7WRA8_MELEN|nr:unnamed protein product [Meloidogyne enterolobii]
MEVSNSASKKRSLDSSIHMLLNENKNKSRKAFQSKRCGGSFDRKLTTGIFGSKYSTSFHSGGNNNVNSSFPIPPVFPKTCSLFDSTFNGGAFTDRNEDKKLMEALMDVRLKLQNMKKNEPRNAENNSETTLEELANLSSDSGNSSIFVDSTQSTLNSKNEFYCNTSLFNSSLIKEDSSNVKTREDGFNPILKRKSDLTVNIPKSERILLFRRRTKSKKSYQEEENEGTKHWTIHGANNKGSTPWKYKLLKAFSTNGVNMVAADGEGKGEKPSHHFGKLDREWEVCAVREICRRLSLEDSLEPSELPLPDGALQSQVLDEFMIRQIVDILPPRAEGYPWVNIYSSEKHGFSLATLYRKMSEWKEEMSPVLLIIRDVVGHVFGAVCSTALQPLTPPHYVGTGDSCLLFRFTGEHPHTRELRTFHWTGDNQFFVNATKDFLSIGAGGLSSITNSRSTCPTAAGLWLDADLNNGRSQNCATFNNEPLAGGLEGDFVIQFVEAFGFSMS